MSNLETRLKNYLNLYWLRPENGLLCVYKSMAFQDIEFKSPSLDLSCGDGLFMFLHLGGKFDENFDYFQSTQANKMTHGSFVDIYDSFSENYHVPIQKSPSTKIDYGSDWKEALLKKAEVLNLYEKLKHHDNNKIPLPFNDNELKTIFSNSIYWVDNVELLLSDIYRVLQPGGTGIFEVMTPHLLDTLDELSDFLSPEAISILDRDRKKTMTSAKTFEDWNKIFKNIGFEIEEIKNIYPSKILVDIWNIGLRPISHLLIQMSDSISHEQRKIIKKEWVDIFYTLFKPLLNLNDSYSNEESPYLLFKVKKPKS